MYRVLSAILLVSGLLLLCSEVSGESEKALLDKARIKIMLKEYAEAAVILEKAKEQYPSSTEVAQTTVSLYEQMKSETEKLIDAYKNLIRLLKLKKVTDASLSAKDSRLLKETQKKLAKLAAIRLEVDAALEEFVREGIKVCDALARRKKYTEASFVFQRLNAVAQGGEFESEIKKLAGELKGKAGFLQKPTGGSGARDEDARKLILDAQKALKAGKYDQARLSCKAALEVDPGFAVAVALLCDIAEKTGDTAGVLRHGLGYLLFHPEGQSVRRAQEIEKRVLKASPELRAFFSHTSKAADGICRAAKKAIRGKKSFDVEYALERLVLMTHRTRKMDSILSKASSVRKARSKKLVNLGKLLLSEDFNVESSDWYLKEGHAFFKKGRYMVRSDQLAPFVSKRLIEFGDFYIEVEMQLIGKAKATTSGGLTFRIQSDYTSYLFLLSPRGKFGVWLVDGGRKKDLTATEHGPPAAMTCCSDSKHIKRGNKKNVIAVAFVEDRLFCYINGHLVFSRGEGSYRKGLLGFVVNTGYDTYAYDNIKIYEASLPGK